MPASGNFFPVLLLSVLVSIISGCGRNPVNSNGKGSHIRQGQKTRPRTTKIIQPENDQLFTIGDAVIARVEKVADTIQNIDSVEFFFGGSKVHVAHEEPYMYEFNTGNQAVGTLSIRAVIARGEQNRLYKRGEGGYPSKNEASSDREKRPENEAKWNPFIPK